MSKKEKYFVFQVKQEGLGQVEVARKVRGPGRPPVGPNIMKADDGNIYVSDVLIKEPEDISGYVVAEVDGEFFWYKKMKPVSKSTTKKYRLDGLKIIDEGTAGRGRPSKGYTKIDEDLIVDGVNLNGHFYSDGVAEVAKPKAPKVNTENEVEISDEIPEGYEAVESDEVESDSDLEAKAMADAAADFAADGEFEEVELEEETV